MAGVIEHAITIAQKEIGVREDPPGSNCGERVEQYQAAGRGKKRDYWCMHFAVWVVLQVVELLQLPEVPILRSGSCDDVLKWARARGILHKTPQVGDIFVRMKSANDADHAGLIIGLLPNGYEESIEGNGSKGGSRNGEWVVHRVSNPSNRLYIRWIDLVPAHLRGGAATKGDAPLAALWNIYVNEKKIGSGPISKGGNVLVPVRTLAEALGVDGSRIGWDGGVGHVTVNGRPVPGISRIEGVAHAEARPLADFFGLSVAPRIGKDGVAPKEIVFRR